MVDIVKSNSILRGKTMLMMAHLNTLKVYQESRKR